jgi:hypothetical protein
MCVYMHALCVYMYARVCVFCHEEVIKFFVENRSWREINLHCLIQNSVLKSQITCNPSTKEAETGGL